MAAREAAPKSWKGRCFEDFDVGDVYRSRLGRTITDADNLLFSCLTMNTNRTHLDAELCRRTEFGQILVNSCFTLALVTGLSAPDTSENGLANLGWDSVTLPSPAFVGDTIWAETEILDLRPSRSRPHAGIVKMRTRGINQRGEVVCEFLRTFMSYRRDAPEAADDFPETSAPWTVGT
jgi:acyl dehydratase